MSKNIRYVIIIEPNVRAILDSFFVKKTASILSFEAYATQTNEVHSSTGLLLKNIKKSV